MEKELYENPSITVIKLTISTRIATSPNDGSFRVSPGGVTGEEHELI